MQSIEELLNEIAPDYYTTSEYKIGKDNFIAEAEHKHCDLKDFCYEALSNNMFGATHYRKIVICYLLQETDEDNSCKYYRFIELMLYKANKESEGKAEFLKVIPREGAEEVLDDMFNGNPPRKLLKLVERICPTLHESKKEKEDNASKKEYEIPVKFTSNFPKLCEYLGIYEFGKIKDGKFNFNGSASQYAFLAEKVTQKFWGVKIIKFAELENYFTHPKFKLESARNKPQEWHKHGKYPKRSKEITLAVNFRDILNPTTMH